MSSAVLKSEKTNIRAFVRFENKTNRQIDVIWVSFHGTFLSYATLDHGQFIDINTFMEHPWLFLDSKTRDRMWVDNKEVFVADRHYTKTRHCVPIRLPVYSLKMSAILTVRNCLKRVKDIHSLEIPGVLKDDIQIAFDTLVTPISPLGTR